MVIAKVISRGSCGHANMFSMSICYIFCIVLCGMVLNVKGNYKRINIFYKYFLYVCCMETKNKTYRFFYHYFKQNKCMSVHYKNQCMQCLNVVCFADTETKWNKAQPQLVIRGFASKIERIEDTIIIHK